jgi:ribosomal protein S18 acetylase RimI-like enzyme
MSVTIHHCNFYDPKQQNAYFTLLNAYISDEMGGNMPLPVEKKGILIESIANNPNTYALLAKDEDKYVGMATYFINFSTFAVKHYMNLHDIFVLPDFRNKGIGRLIINKLVTISLKNDYCKLTLEVREDNAKAQSLYGKMGFEFVKPVNMLFMEKRIC